MSRDNRTRVGIRSAPSFWVMYFPNTLSAQLKLWSPCLDLNVSVNPIYVTWPWDAMEANGGIGMPGGSSGSRSQPPQCLACLAPWPHLAEALRETPTEWQDVTSDVCCRVFIDNGQDVFREEKVGQVTLLGINKGSKSFLLKKTRGIDIVLRTKIRELLVAILD